MTALRTWISRSRASAAPAASARSRAGSTQLPGIIDARLNFTNRRLAVDWRDDELDAADVIEALERIGYRAHPFAPERAEADEARRRAG